MHRTKFLALSENPIKRYEIIFKPSSGPNSWNVRIFNISIVYFRSWSNDIKDPNIFISIDASRWDLSYSLEKKRDSERKIFINHYFIAIFHRKKRFFRWNLHIFIIKRYQDNSLPKFFLYQKIAREKLHLLVY